MQEFETPTPQRIALGVEYDGSAYCGWQRQQPGVATVQGRLETALSRVANHPVSMVCAGRTDAGVHAVGQVIHFDTTAQRSERSWVLGTNSNLPKDIAVAWAKPVSSEFHARFGAVRRRYRYVILNSAIRSPLLASQVALHHPPLDIEPMRAAAQALKGRHDFSAYRSSICQSKDPVKTVHEVSLERRGELIVMEIEANAFLHHMVRNIAGVLMSVGEGKNSVNWPGQVLRSRDRTQGGVTAPPGGLYFMMVSYDQVFALPVSRSQLVIPQGWISTSQA